MSTDDKELQELRAAARARLAGPKKRVLTEQDVEDAQQARVVIATPSRGDVCATYAYDLAYLMRTSQATFVLSMGSLLPTLRSSLAGHAVNAGATHILFIDSDMRFPPDTIMQLVSRKKSVIGANCRVRATNQIAWTARQGDGFISSVGKQGIQQVEVLGFGVTLIETKMFEELEEPLFFIPWDSVNSKYVGEDVFFCNKIRDAGYEVWADHDLSQEVRHTSEYEKGVDNAIEAP